MRYKLQLTLTRHDKTPITFETEPFKYESEAMIFAMDYGKIVRDFGFEVTGKILMLDSNARIAS